MSDLGEALELMYLAPYAPFSTLRVSFRDTSNPGVTWRAMYSSAIEEAPGVLRWEKNGMTGVIHGATPPDPGEQTSEQALRLWIEAPDRLRVERDTSVAVRDGERWWQYHPWCGVYSNEDDPSMNEPIGEEVLPFLDPSPLVGAFRFEARGRETIAGREAICLRGILRGAGPGQMFAIRHLRVGHMPTNEFEYAVDAERGLLLRQAALIDGEQYWAREVVEIAIDDDLPDDTFEPPAGDRAVLNGGPIRAEVMLEEAVKLASFPVFDLGPGGAPPETVYLHYWLGDASHAIDAEQSPAAGDAEGERIEEFRERPAGSGSSGQWERVTDGEPKGEYRVVGAGVTVHRNGTSITVRSMTLDTERVLGLVEKLRPAGSDEPR